jgi:low temperature requirement protein LtrA
LALLNRGIFKPPTLRFGYDREKERHATWLELFYDLVFVGAVSQLASNLNEDYSPLGVLKFSALFVPVWWAWAGHTFYLTRFDSDNVGRRFLTMIQIIAVASLAVHAPGALGNMSAGFALSYAAVRFMLVTEYLRAGRYIPHVRVLTNRYCLGFGLAASLWALSALVATPWRFWLWGLAVIVDFLAPLTAGELHARFPPHLMHLPERFGLFTIIVIGEAVVSVVMGIGKQGLNFVSGTVGIMGLLMAYSLWWGYFEGAKGAATLTLLSTGNVYRYQLWLYSHIALVLGITSTAVGVKHLIGLSPWQTLSGLEGWVLSCSVGISVVALSLIMLATNPVKPATHFPRILALYVIIAILGMSTGALSNTLPGVAILAILTGLCFVQVLVSIWRTPFPHED